MDNYTKLYTIPRGGAICKFVFALLGCLMIAMQGYGQDAEAYVVVSDDKTTLTFYCDGHKEGKVGTIYDITATSEYNSSIPAWHSFTYNEEFNTYDCTTNNYTTVTFDPSFANAHPTSCYSWFVNCCNLTQINGINNLKTDQVINMGNMFAGCTTLKNLDVSGFDTHLVTNMAGMFTNCGSLTSLDVSKFDTQEVINMEMMFLGCESLTKLDLRYFNTQKVINMEWMFGDCYDLTELNISSFNTSNVSNMCLMFSACTSLAKLDVSSFDTKSVTTMQAMFAACENLTVLDLRSFNTANVTIISEMFYNCDKLTTILVNQDYWNINNLRKTIDGPYYTPFSGSSNLIGNAGTTYDANNTDTTYAKVDDPSKDKPGYLTTDSYKIFYDLNGGEWDGEQGANEFALTGRTEDIIIPYPKKAGFIFDGWTGTLASGLSSNQPIKDVTITTDQQGNRIYTAHWTIADENEIEISYPQTEQEREVYCDLHQDKSITLELNPNEIRDVYYYQIAIEELNINIEGNSFYNNSGYEIPITLPAQLTSNEYTGSINFFSSSDSKEPILKYKLTIKLLMPQNLILHLYEDVIFVSNGDSLYNPYKWQWYKNGQPINGATRQYIYDNEMSGNTYMCKMQTKDGLEVYTCPFTEPSLTKSLSQSVTIAPNPASEGEPINVKIANFDPETDYTITISNSNGVVVRTIYHANENNTINLNRGIYSGALIFNGNKKGFKLIVR